MADLDDLSPDSAPWDEAPAERDENTADIFGGPPALEVSPAPTPPAVVTPVAPPVVAPVVAAPAPVVVVPVAPEPVVPAPVVPDPVDPPRK